MYPHRLTFDQLCILTYFLCFYSLYNTIEIDPDARVSTDNLLNLYQNACKAHNSTPINNVHFGRLIKKMFPTVHIVHTNDTKNRNSVHIYSGIGIVNEVMTGEIMTLTELRSIVPSYAAIISSTENELVIGVWSDIITNGNAVVKYLTFTTNTCTLKVRTNEIDLYCIGLTPKYNSTKCSFLAILYIVSKIQVCFGKELPPELNNVSKCVIKEYVTIKGDDNSNSKAHYRSVKCLGVLTWEQIGKTCKKCLSNLNVFNKKCNANDEKTVYLSLEDHNDLSKILTDIFPNASAEMKEFLQGQRQALLANGSKTRRWDKNMLKACLSLWIRSPIAYQNLIDSNMLILPSGRQLRRYKNCVPQVAGINANMLKWMHEAAKQVNLPKEGYFGGLIHDETKIQQDIIWKKTGKLTTIVGFVDTGCESINIKTLRASHVQQTVATEVLQVSFVGYTGFRFPIAHFPTVGNYNNLDSLKVDSLGACYIL